MYHFLIQVVISDVLKMLPLLTYAAVARTIN